MPSRQDKLGFNLFRSLLQRPSKDAGNGGCGSEAANHVQKLSEYHAVVAFPARRRQLCRVRRNLTCELHKLLNFLKMLGANLIPSEAGSTQLPWPQDESKLTKPAGQEHQRAAIDTDNMRPLKSRVQALATFVEYLFQTQTGCSGGLAHGLVTEAPASASVKSGCQMSTMRATRVSGPSCQAFAAHRVLLSSTPKPPCSQAESPASCS